MWNWEGLNLTPEQLAVLNGDDEGNEEFKGLSDEPRDHLLDDIKLSPFELEQDCPKASNVEIYEVLGY